jgi:Skp family chaperone for outer membrane proteins
MYKLVFLTLMIAFSINIAANAGVYKCQVGSKTVYQQRPCATVESQELAIRKANTAQIAAAQERIERLKQAGSDFSDFNGSIADKRSKAQEKRYKKRMERKEQALREREIEAQESQARAAWADAMWK